MPSKPKIGVIVNPIAGMGGRVGLRGTDNLADFAREQGAKPIAGERAMRFLRALVGQVSSETELWSVTEPMGEDECRSAGFVVHLIDYRPRHPTSAVDTINSVAQMLEKEIDLIVFVGGDGTARDILDAWKASPKDNSRTVFLGCPSGVKMYSAIFSTTPEAAAEITGIWLQGRAELAELEVMDANEEAIRHDSFDVKLHGYLPGLFVPLRIQGGKQVSPSTEDERENQLAIARTIEEGFGKSSDFILGPGTTVRTVAEFLVPGSKKTLLGVDLVIGGELIPDVNEKEILRHWDMLKSPKIVVSPIGHQGMLFGRGNQQVSPEIIKNVGRDNIIVVATPSKLRTLEGAPFRVDTGDLAVDSLLSGYIRVVTDYREWRMWKISS